MKIALLLLAACISGCTHIKPASHIGWITISPDRTRFVQTSKPPDRCPADSQQSFRPWGFNYDRDYKMRLIEDYWDSEWRTVAEDFREMKNLGANVVRVHLQFAKFMKGPRTPNGAALSLLRKLLQLSERTGLHLDLTGLACYRKSDVPDWYNALDEAGRWAAQAVFWEAVARTCRHSSAVFCYDLMNEPFVPGSPRKEGDWLVGELAGLWYVQAITLDPAGRDRAGIAREWTDKLAAAIRKHDKHHLITVGMLPNGLETPVSGSGFVPSKVADSLDFISVHVYPGSKTIEADLQNLRGFSIGKPLVVEEIFPLGCNIVELEDFMNRSRSFVNGWIGFYWGQIPEQLAAEKTIPAAMLLEWLKFFQANGPTNR